MSTSTQLALVLALLAVGFAVPACHRFDDPPEPLAPQGLSVFGLGREQAAPPEIVVESPPIIVKAEADGAIVTAADVIRQRASTGNAAAVEHSRLDLRYDSADKPAAGSGLWW